MSFRFWSLLKKLSSSIWEILSGCTFRRLLFFLLSKNTLNLSLYILLTEYPIKTYFRYIFYSTICFIPNILGEIWKNQMSIVFPLCKFPHRTLTFKLIFGLWATFPGYCSHLLTLEETGPCLGTLSDFLQHSCPAFHHSLSVVRLGVLACNPRRTLTPALTC